MARGANFPVLDDFSNLVAILGDLLGAFPETRR